VSRTGDVLVFPDGPDGAVIKSNFCETLTLKDACDGGRYLFAFPFRMIQMRRTTGDAARSQKMTT